MFVINVQPGQEVLATVTEQAKAQGVANAALVSLIGAVDSACISNMPKGDARNQGRQAAHSLRARYGRRRDVVRASTLGEG